MSEPFASELPLIAALRRTMERHAHRYRALHSAAQPHVRYAVREWFRARYLLLATEFVNQINACDQIISKGYFFEYYRPLVGHKELFTATVTEEKPKWLDDDVHSLPTHARRLELTTSKPLSLP